VVVFMWESGVGEASSGLKLTVNPFLGISSAPILGSPRPSNLYLPSINLKNTAGKGVPKGRD